jgi:thioredoxin 2
MMTTQMNTQDMHVGCANCATVNRVAAKRLGEGPKCGECGAALLPAAPVELNDATYDTVIARTGLPVLVDFWAPWCGPCKMMAPQFEVAAHELHKQALLAKVNTDEAQAVAARVGIRSIPTLVLFKEGREIARTSGAMDVRGLLRWYKENA